MICPSGCFAALAVSRSPWMPVEDIGLEVIQAPKSSIACGPEAADIVKAGHMAAPDD
jgi:hypothetical protein